MQSINLNTLVKVKLTDYGKKVLISNHLALCRENEFDDIDNYLRKIDKNGYFVDELWSLMSIFGELFYVGCEQIFENNEIIIGEIK